MSFVFIMHGIIPDMYNIILIVPVDDNEMMLGTVRGRGATHRIHKLTTRMVIGRGQRARGNRGSRSPPKTNLL